MVGDQPLNERAVDSKFVTALFAGVMTNLPSAEVDHNRQVLADAEQDRAAYACPDVAGQFQQWLDPGLELGEHAYPWGGPAALLRRDAILHSRGVAAKGTLLCGEGLHRLLSAHGPPHLEVIVINLEYCSGGQQLATLKSLVAQVVQEDDLVGEGAGRVSCQGVEGEQVLIEKAWRARGGHDIPGANGLYVTGCPVKAVCPFRGTEPAFRGSGQLIAPRPPDGARILEHVHVVRSERLQRAQVWRAGVILVEDPRGPVIDR